jgi:hypothetical protein
MQDELETYNSHLRLATRPRWLLKPEKRADKMHSSVVLAFESEEEAKSAIRRRLFVAGISARTARFIGVKPDTQCQRCQDFGHGQATCKKQPRCQLCAESHETRDHKCAICTTPVKGKVCAHTIYKCVNCGGPHRANNPDCDKKRAVRPINAGDDIMVEDQ